MLEDDLFIRISQTEERIEMNQPAASKEGQLMEREIEPDAGALSAIVGAEVDKQIATAKRFPRSVQKFQEEATTLVSLNEDVAAECFYSLKRDDKQIMGPSARFAEIVAYSWGNCRAGARVVSEGSEFITAQGFAWDLEKNTAIGYEVQRRIVGSRGQRYSVDMIGVTANAACSIALRNAILKVVPKALWSKMYDKAIETVRGDFKTFESRRAKALETLKLFGVDPAQVYEKLGVKGEADITIDHIVELRGYATAIKDGETTPEELFPKPRPKEERGAGHALKEALRPAAGAAQTDPKLAVSDASAQLKNHSDLETMTLYADSLPEEVRSHEDFTKAFAARKAEIATKTNAEAERDRKAGGKAAGTPKLRKAYVEKFGRSDAETLDVAYDETRGFIWSNEDADLLTKAYEERKEALGK